MNIDNDYDNDGNNIVPCPICLSVHCPSKEDGKCHEEDEFVKAMSHQPSKSNEDWKITFENEFGGWWNYKSALTERIEDYIQALIDAEREKAVEAEREKVILEIKHKLNSLKKEIPPNGSHWLKYNFAITEATIEVNNLLSPTKDEEAN